MWFKKINKKTDHFFFHQELDNAIIVTNYQLNRVQIIPAANRSGRVLVQDQATKVQEPNGRNETEDSNSKNGDKVRN